MNTLLPFPLPDASNAVAVNTLSPGDTFLRVAGTPSVTQANLWELVAIDGNGNVSMRDVIVPGDVITGVAGNMPVVPLPGRFVPNP